MFELQESRRELWQVINRLPPGETLRISRRILRSIFPSFRIEHLTEGINGSMYEDHWTIYEDRFTGEIVLTRHI